MRSQTLELPVKNVLAGVRNTDFYAPGSLMAITLDAHASRREAHEHAPIPAAWFEDSPAFEITDPTRAAVVARIRPPAIRCSPGGCSAARSSTARRRWWMSPSDAGTSILFGFRPQYRGQSMNTQPLLWGAILR